MPDAARRRQRQYLVGRMAGSGKNGTLVHFNARLHLLLRPVMLQRGHQNARLLPIVKINERIGRHEAGTVKQIGRTFTAIDNQLRLFHHDS